MVRGRRGGPRAYDVPEGCFPRALTSDAVGVTCTRPPATGSLVLSLDDGSLQPVQAMLPPIVEDERLETAVLGIGRRWVHLRTTRSSPSGGRDMISQALVERGTNRTIDLTTDPFGARRVLDLDRATPARPLCKGGEADRSLRNRAGTLR